VNVTVRRALLSVSDKTGLIELAQALARRKVEILSTGGTAQLLAASGIAVTDVANYTGFPEIMDGRVKTLHPKIHGGLLGRHGVDEAVMAEHEIAPIDLVVVNLYPFGAVSARADTPYALAVENIDVGGPAMARAAAKNHERVAVIVDPHDYRLLIEELARENGATTQTTRQRFAAKAFFHTAAYDAQVARYLLARHPNPSEDFPALLTLAFERVQNLRYGENPQQRAAFYRDVEAAGATVANARVVQGKELSFNNIADADAAIECVRQFEEPACVIVKHASPCGAASAATLSAAYEQAYRTDPTSAFGGIIALNAELDERTAAAILARQFVEVLAAPIIPAAARDLLSAKPNIRVLELGYLGAPQGSALEYRSVAGGLLAQTRDRGALSPKDLKSVTRRTPSERETLDLLFAWRVCKFVKSNAIVFARESATIGIGAGQTSRVLATRIAAIKATEQNLVIAGAVLASDGFLPFRDSIDAAAAQGIRALIQPGGSMRDSEVIQAADEHDLAMVFTGMRHFRH
jgi:phosphoribosylaminoimidazolecarboxamide formyltransferase / IMP cyclohydrolase